MSMQAKQLKGFGKLLKINSSLTRRGLALLFTAGLWLPAANAQSTPPSASSIEWAWKYVEQGVVACGKMQTTETPDASGYYQILSISGRRGQDPITALVPAGQAIPGNEPYAVDNLIQPTHRGQLTINGFGYALASGAYANPYFNDTASYLGSVEVYITADSFREVPILFQATPLSGPDSDAAVVAMVEKCRR